MSDDRDTTDERVAREALTHDSPFYPITPERMLLETRPCVAFLDTTPVSKGPTQVVAKTVAPSLFDLPVGIQTELWEAVRQVRQMLIERFGLADFNIGINDGAVAGQTIACAHVHVIPRYRHDVADPRGGVRWIIPTKARYR
jgi:diadenosine tetraphosphate (Ap4A) HIT family hydrolase